MSLGQAIEFVKAKTEEIQRFLKGWFEREPRRAGVVILAVGLLLVYSCSRRAEKTNYLYDGPAKKFSQARIIENPYKHIAANKIEILEESEDRIRRDSREIQKQISEIRSVLEELKSGSGMKTEARGELPPHAAIQTTSPPPTPAVNGEVQGEFSKDATTAPPMKIPENQRPKIQIRVASPSISGKGPASLSFPVGLKMEEKNTNIVIPSGSYVKAKIVSGVRPQTRSSTSPRGRILQMARLPFERETWRCFVCACEHTVRSSVAYFGSRSFAN